MWFDPGNSKLCRLGAQIYISHGQEWLSHTNFQGRPHLCDVPEVPTAGYWWHEGAVPSISIVPSKKLLLISLYPIHVSLALHFSLPILDEDLSGPLLHDPMVATRNELKNQI
jgi:hypothetical protein